jgi:protein gp37
MENTKIEWATHTFNCWQGCTKVSQGCKFCYAEAMSKRWGRDIWGPGTERVRTSEAYWRKPLAWNKQAQKDGIRPRVFCASMADVFEDHPQLIEWRKDLFRLIELTHHLDWLLLTKRPENVIRMINAYLPFSNGVFTGAHQWLPYNNHIWIGMSVESQDHINRVGELYAIPAAVKFLSCEPLLGPIDLSEHIGIVDWVIAGGESGPHARPVDPAWVRSLRDQCTEAGVPFFFKQWGGKNKKAAGRLLDGREWSEFPK